MSELKSKFNEDISASIALRESEENYRALVEDMPALVCRFLPDGTLTFVNNPYCRYFNKTRDELLGANFFQFIPAQEREEVRKQYRSLTQESPAINYEHQVYTPDGDVHWQRWTDRALFDEKNNLYQYQSIGFDITESKKVEQALRISEERFREMTELMPLTVFESDIKGCLIDITDRKKAEEDRRRLETQFHQAQKLETIGTLAGGIAHDFNNLMATILGNTSLLLYDIDTTHPHYEPLKNIEQQIKRGAELTTQLLGYARKGKYSVKPVNLNQIVEESATAFGRTRKEITIQCELADDLFVVETDQGQIQQVLLNIFVNIDVQSQKGQGSQFSIFLPASDKKVLLSSGYSIDDQAREIMGRGCDGFIQKPFSMKAMSDKLSEILSKKGT